MKRARICILLALTLVFVLGFGSTALATNPPPFSLESVSGSGISNIVYDWEIQKTADIDEANLAVGESQNVNYVISLTKDEGTENNDLHNTIYGSLKLKVNWDTVNLDIKAMVKTKNNQYYDEQVFPSKNYTKGNYTVEYTSTGNYNSSTEYEVVFGVKKQGDQNYSYLGSGFDPAGFKLKGVNDSITVTDVQDSGGLPVSVSFVNSAEFKGIWESIDTTSIIAYSTTFTNDSNKTASEGLFNNTATINEFENKNSSASVTIKTPRTSSGGDPEPREERKVRWPDRTPPPDEAASAAAVELPHTGGFIEWEWIALAGGMLASGGGALYLVRRRKMKK